MKTYQSEYDRWVQREERLEAARRWVWRFGMVAAAVAMAAIGYFAIVGFLLVFGAA